MAKLGVAVLGLLSGGAAPKMAPNQSPIPIEDMVSWENANDYPSRAIRERRQGTTGFRLTIGADGRVLDCQVVSSSGYNFLDIATCDHIRRRGRFTPATDNKGRPVQGTFASARIWVLPPPRCEDCWLAAQDSFPIFDPRN